MRVNYVAPSSKHGHGANRTTYPVEALEVTDWFLMPIDRGVQTATQLTQYWNRKFYEKQKVNLLRCIKTSLGYVIMRVR